MKHRDIIEAAESVRVKISEALASKGNVLGEAVFLDEAKKYLDMSIRALCHAHSQARMEAQKDMDTATRAMYQMLDP